MIGAHPLPEQQQDPVMFEGAARETGLPEQPARPAGGGAAEGAGYGDGQQAAQFLETVNQTRDGDHFSESLTLTGNVPEKKDVKQKDDQKFTYIREVSGEIQFPVCVNRDHTGARNP